MLFRALSQTFLQPAVSVLKKKRQIALISTQKAFFLQYSRFLLKKINKFRSFNSQKRSFLQPALLLLKNRKVSGPSHPIFADVLFTYTAPTIKRYCFNFSGTFSLMVDIKIIAFIAVLFLSCRAKCTLLCILIYEAQALRRHHGWSSRTVLSCRDTIMWQR